MTEKRVFRASSPTDLLALVPGLIGFHPEDSLVLMSVGEGRQPLHARVDLPPPDTDPVTVEGFVAHVAGMVDRTDLRRFVLLVYSGDAGLAEAVVDPLADRLRARGADVLCAVRADGRRWWPVGAAPDDAGTAYDVGTHPFTAQLVVDGTVVHRSRRALAASLRGDTATEAAERAEIDALLPVLAHGGARHGPVRVPAGAVPHVSVSAEARWVAKRVRRFRDDGLRLDTLDAARLALAASASVALRDVAWAEITPEHARRYVDLWRDLVRRVPGRVRAAPASLLAFAAWLSGEGALAWCAVDRALEADPDYSLAMLLADVLQAGMPPSSWRPVAPGDLPLSAG